MIYTSRRFRRSVAVLFSECQSCHFCEISCVFFQSAFFFKSFFLRSASCRRFCSPRTFDVRLWVPDSVGSAGEPLLRCCISVRMRSAAGSSTESDGQLPASRHAASLSETFSGFCFKRSLTMACRQHDILLHDRPLHVCRRASGRTTSGAPFLE